MKTIVPDLVDNILSGFVKMLSSFCSFLNNSVEESSCFLHCFCVCEVFKFSPNNIHCIFKLLDSSISPVFHLESCFLDFRTNFDSFSHHSVTQLFEFICNIFSSILCLFVKLSCKLSKGLKMIFHFHYLVMHVH